MVNTSEGIINQKKVRKEMTGDKNRGLMATVTHKQGMRASESISE